MKYLKWLLPLLSALCGAGAASAAVQLHRSELASGMDVVLMEDHKVPLVTLVLAVKAGAMTETADINGLTHLWEHMFFKGNAVIPNQEAYNRRIRQLGIVYNGDTSAEKVRYYFTMPSSFLEQGIKFMYDAIATPKLDAGELEKERVVVMDEYNRSAAQPGFDRNRLIRSIIYGDLAYRRDPLGDAEVIQGATQEQLLRIKNEVFVPQNSALMISGDFDKEKTVAMIEKIFGPWQNPKDWKLPEHPPLPAFPKTTSFVMTRPNVQNAEVNVSFPGPKAQENVKDTFVADLLISLLGMQTGRFYKDYIDSGLTMGAGLHYPTQKHAGELVLYAVCKAENAMSLQKRLVSEAAKWADPNYFTKEQLEDVRRSLLIDHKRELNQPSEYIKTLAFWWAITGLDYYESYLDNLRKISLTDITDFARRYFVKKPYVSSILLSPEQATALKIKDDSAPLVAKYLKSNNSAE